MTKYDNYTAEQLNEHLSNYLINHWSYSAVRQFRRNEKAFEKKYIFNIFDNLKKASTLAGDIYHKCLCAYFQNIRNKKEKLSLAALVKMAQELFDQVPLTEIAATKKMDQVEVKQKAEEAVNVLLSNFLKEFDIYEDDIQEILFIEESFESFVNVAGEDVPLPLRGKPDIVYIDKAGELAVTDHKSKDKYTDEEDIDLCLSEQFIAYKKVLEKHIESGKIDTEIVTRYPKIREGLKHFYYYENKHSMNKDRTRQIRRIVINMEEQVIRTYEQFFYEGIARMIRAVSDPDYVYLPNPDDMLEDGGDIMAFWIKSKIDDIAIYENLSDSQKALLQKRKKKSVQIGLDTLPKTIIERVTKPEKFISFNLKDMEASMIPAQRIESRLRYFNLMTKVAKTIPGYQSIVYLLQVGAGTRIKQILSCEMDIANALGVETVRIAENLVRVDGESYVSIEVNQEQSKRTFPHRPQMQGNVIPIGISNYGEVVSWNLDNASTPHFMVSGASGSGKSVTIRSVLQYAQQAGCRVTILDPKREFDDSIMEQKDIEYFIAYMVEEMEEIFKKGVQKEKHIIIFDESADAFMRETKYPKNSEIKTLSQNILILSQKARSAGIHLLLAAQRFSTKILTGDVKANFTMRLALTCAKEVDSKVMIDEGGAEKLNGYGDGLIVSPEYSTPVRIQCFS